MFWWLRRDSFITHRAFCDALAEESARAQTLAIMGKEGDINVKSAVASPPPPPLTPSTTVVSPGLSVQSSGNLIWLYLVGVGVAYMYIVYLCRSKARIYRCGIHKIQS